MPALLQRLINNLPGILMGAAIIGICVFGLRSCFRKAKSVASGGGSQIEQYQDGYARDGRTVPISIVAPNKLASFPASLVYEDDEKLSFVVHLTVEDYVAKSHQDPAPKLVDTMETIVTFTLEKSTGEGRWEQRWPLQGGTFKVVGAKANSIEIDQFDKNGELFTQFIYVKKAKS